jgi:hypothetical protein
MIGACPPTVSRRGKPSQSTAPAQPPAQPKIITRHSQSFPDPKSKIQNPKSKIQNPKILPHFSTTQMFRKKTGLPCP